MNAAFLLVTTAWLTGAQPPADTAPPPTGQAVKPAPTTGGTGSGAPGAPAMRGPGAPVVGAPGAPVVGGPAGSCCGGGDCGSSCGGDCCGGGHGFRERLHGLFARHRGNDCCETCAPAQTCCAAPSCASSCECGESWGHRMRSRLHGLFRRNSCCEAECGGCGGGGCCGDGHGGSPVLGPGGIGPRPEPIPAPKETPGKKMPSGNGSGTSSTQILTPDASLAPRSTPTFESAPAIVPNVPAGSNRREPF